MIESNILRISYYCQARYGKRLKNDNEKKCMSILFLYIYVYSESFSGFPHDSRTCIREMYNGSLNFLFSQDIEVDIKVETGKSEGRREKIFNSGMHPGSLARAYGRRLENFHACSR